MQLALGFAASTVKGPASDETEAVFSRAYELSCRGGESRDLVLALSELARMHFFRGAVHKARDASQEILEVASRIQDPAGVASAHYMLGMALQILAELAQARERLERSLALFESDPHLYDFRSRTGVPVYLVAPFGFLVSPIKRSN